MPSPEQLEACWEEALLLEIELVVWLHNKEPTPSTMAVSLALGKLTAEFIASIAIKEHKDLNKGLETLFDAMRGSAEQFVKRKEASSPIGERT